ncbi:hypothetical protein CGCA056_v006129 [Colletotrichum aenigma]|uniref:uncharacterized protein n=1 Tax=Colletotrichum aenigma TaxID=1215731 RepID=UPI0018730F8D|nr:uncharacterized protein CGCA056_v015023 [Colletotrichum aenigma]XP_037172421.1 uncharacterized protein CGCA056_v014637 [Colletotrichum aenigma]XP_037175413.1 uncharacterized protein CGCA056_v010388 [Colletotrichum aenigma]XP_037175878.1 uncharacterized protein CGCA056_v011167 [Colletotrichum aenigma]XP_037176611.1 uncharacterized protein CGCA056_v009161 [Colletotrichum aenigma]XP_037179226.1 uncharacterized protein CGCA056_v006129 [Colletotrichum aenigma]KAF5495393.1 hypothetical protein C
MSCPSRSTPEWVPSPKVLSSRPNISRSLVPENPAISTLRRYRRSFNIAENGFEVMPCRRCRSKGLRCKMLPGSLVCGECVAVGGTRRSCNASDDAICQSNSCVVERLMVESRRLDDEEEETEELFRKRMEVLQKAQAEVNEALAKLDRVRKAKRMVFKKGRKETLVVAEEESSLVLEARSVGAFGAIDLDTVLGDWNPGTPNFLSEAP